MSWHQPHHTPWVHISGVLLAAFFLVFSVVTPQYYLALSRHFPVTASLLAVIFALLMTLIRWQQNVARKWTAPLIQQMTAPLSVLYTFLVWIPFLLGWVLLSSRGFPIWPAVGMGLAVPLLLLFYLWRQNPAQTSVIDPLYRILALHRAMFYALILLTSLFFGIGLPLLGLFLWALFTNQGFGPLVITNFGLVFLFGAIIAGGIFGMTLRQRD